MAKQLLEQYTKLRMTAGEADCFDELRLNKPYGLVDKRRQAIEDARQLGKTLGIDIPGRRVVGSLNIQHKGVFGYVDIAEGGLRRALNAHNLDTSVKDVQLEKVIASSRSILELGDNWDEEGSPGYDEETWKRATQFVRKVAWAYKKENGKWIDPPKITPGPDGSVDTRWKTPNRSLLINFPSNEFEPADFFGSDKGKDTIKGTLDLTSQNLWLLMWLMR
jgi:hypothetical protein